MAQKEYIWKDRWREKENIGKGGQGLVYRAEDTHSGMSDFALKKLKVQTDKNKRARMYREVAAYKTLKFKGIPALVDTNAELYEGNQPLFLVTEYIPGPTLEEYIKGNGPLDLNSAISFVLRLLGIVKYSHSQEVIHRDIKPDNIILKDGNIGDVNLIDFGLSFNKDDEQRVTPASEQLTNRFLHLPELNNQKAKIDFRTDITYCGGILFYGLTGIYPIDLVDHDNRMPHQREAAEAIIAKIPKHQVNIIRGIFDRVFVTQIDYRYQSIEALENDLNTLMNTKAEQDIQPEEKINRFREAMKSTIAGSKLSSTKELFSLIDKTHSNTIVELSKELGDGFVSKQTGYTRDFKNYVFANQVSLTSEIDGKKEIWPVFTATITGNELICEMKEGNDSENIRQPLSDINWGELKKFIRNYFVKRLDKLS